MECPEYYKTLNCNIHSTQDEIRKAYRKLSLQHHPDRNGGDSGIFKCVNEAYETLGDPDKRKKYDIMSQNPFLNAGMGNMDINIDPGNIFSMMFGQDMGGMQPEIHIFHSGGAMPSHSNIHNMVNEGIHNNINDMLRKTISKPEPLVKSVTITLEESYNGCSKPMEIERWVLRYHRKVLDTETLYVDIPPGIDHKETIIIKNKGNMVNESLIGDIKVVIHVENSYKNMERQGLDIIYKQTITLKDALCGFSFSLKHINGKEFKLNNAKGNIIYPEFEKTIPNYGFIRNGHTGNLIIQFSIDFPRSLTNEQITKIENIF